MKKIKIEPEHTISKMNIDDNERVEVIDLCTPTRLPETLPSIRTWERFPNLHLRFSIMPWFPMNETQDQGYPLLVNVPPHQLTRDELKRRETCCTFTTAFNIVNYDSPIPSFLREKYTLFFQDLISRLKVNLTLLDYNYTRLNQYIRTLSYEQMQVFNYRPHEIQRIDEKEYPLALEFYLQFDIHMFYMKTCSFRYARPRTLNEGLFCLQEPEARYDLTPCGNCGLCYPAYDMTYRSKKYVVEFNDSHKHTFLNGYQAILNCSATCYTRNIIYTLICPCGKVDYIGATKNNLRDRLLKHRAHSNRVIHEFLLGQDNILRDLRSKTKPHEIIVKDRMKLYQHIARCPVAIQIFLDANPQYWSFIPMTLEESERSEQKLIEHPILFDELDSNRRLKRETQLYVESVPKPPKGYVFSNQQIAVQTEYFHHKKDKILPNFDIDLYNATTVAVLPENCTDMFRLLIESLFITHAETQLNSIGNILNRYTFTDVNPWLIRGDQWCQGLLRRPEK